MRPLKPSNIVSNVALLLAALCMGCAGGDPTYLDEPVGNLPESMSELGLYAAEQVHPAASAYAPNFPLWSSGSDKERFVVLPASGVVSEAADGSWLFPEGALFFKTFEWRGQRVETRVLRFADGEWHYDVYRWDGDEAFLVDLSGPTTVTLDDPDSDGETFDYEIPSLRQCRTCHEATPAIVLGFSAIQLGEGAPHLDRIPSTDAAITAPDETTREVLGYMEGNCTHCHNGRVEFDLRHEVALENLIGQSTASSGAEPGIRVVPGNPMDSLMLRFLQGSTSTDMPPLGVQRRDEAAIELVERWIVELEP